jgi:hypothetical protein
MSDRNEVLQHLPVLMMTAKRQLGYNLKPKAISGIVGDFPMKYAFNHYQHYFITWYNHTRRRWSIIYINTATNFKTEVEMADFGFETSEELIEHFERGVLPYFRLDN